MERRSFLKGVTVGGASVVFGVPIVAKNYSDIGWIRISDRVSINIGKKLIDIKGVCNGAEAHDDIINFLLTRPDIEQISTRLTPELYMLCEGWDFKNYNLLKNCSFCCSNKDGDVWYYSSIVVEFYRRG